jgi:hypothetical protein
MPKRKAQLPEQAQHIIINQHRLYYRTVGSGPPLYLFMDMATQGMSGNVYSPILHNTIRFLL